MLIVTRIKMCEAELTACDTTMDVLPDEILLQIFEHVPCYRRINMGLVCQRWRTIMKMNIRRYNYELSIADDGVYIEEGNQISYSIAGKSPSEWSQYLEHIGWGLNSIVILSRGDRVPGILQVIARTCSQISCLELTKTDNGVTPEDILALAKGCKELEMFFIYDATGECDNELEMLFRENPKLSDLIIGINSNITGSCLKGLADKKHSLNRIVIKSKTIDTKYLDVLRDIDVRQIVYTFSGLDGTREMNALEKMSRAGESLVHLDMESYNHSIDDDFGQLSRLTGLVVLNLRGCKQLNDSHIIAITNNCRRLRAINLSGCAKISNTAVRHVFELPELRAFGLNNITKTVFTCLDIPQLVPKMTSLELVNTSVGWLALLHLIERAPRLRHLIISRKFIIEFGSGEMMAQARLRNGPKDQDLAIEIKYERPRPPIVWMLKPDLKVLICSDYDDWLGRDIHHDMISGLSKREQPNFPEDFYLPWFYS